MLVSKKISAAVSMKILVLPLSALHLMELFQIHSLRQLLRCNIYIARAGVSWRLRGKAFLCRFFVDDDFSKSQCFSLLILIKLCWEKWKKKTKKYFWLPYDTCFLMGSFVCTAGALVSLVVFLLFLALINLDLWKPWTTVSRLFLTPSDYANVESNDSIQSSIQNKI